MLLLLPNVRAETGGEMTPKLLLVIYETGSEEIIEWADLPDFIVAHKYPGKFPGIREWHVVCEVAK